MIGIAAIIILIVLGFTTQLIIKPGIKPSLNESIEKTKEEPKTETPETQEGQKNEIPVEQKTNIPLKKIAFVSGPQLYIINSDGSNLVKIANISEAARIEYPTWSPDEKYIAVVAYFYKEFDWPVILVVEVKMGKIIELSEVNAKIDATKDDIKWSPDGKRLVFRGYEHDFSEGLCKKVYDVFIVNFEKDFEIVNVSKLGIKSYEEITGVDWSSDGKRIAYCTRKSIHIFNLEQREYEKNFTLPLGQMLEIDEGFAWNGKNFVFSNDGISLCIMTADGEIFQLPTSSENIKCLFLNYPSWLDEQRIVFEALVYNETTREEGRQICLVDIGTSKIIVLTQYGERNRMPSCAP